MIKVSKKNAYVSGIIISLICAIILSCFIAIEIQKFEAFSDLSIFRIAIHFIPFLFMIFEIANLLFIIAISHKK